MTTNGLTSYTATIPPALAQEWLECMSYFGQRPIDQKRVSYYAREMLVGEWLPGISMALGVLNGSRYLLDGQHRLRAIVESGMTCQFTVIEHPARDEAHLAKMYAEFDVGKGRTIMDTLKPNRLDEGTGLSNTHLRHLVAGIRVLVGGFVQVDSLRIPHREMPDLISEWAPYMVSYLAAIGDRPADISTALDRRTTIAIALPTIRFCREKAEPFWQGVSQDNGLLIGDPRKALRRWMIAHAPKSKMSTTDRTLEVHAVCVYLMTAWNAWFEGREQNILKVYDSRQAIHLHGTPI